VEGPQCGAKFAREWPAHALWAGSGSGPHSKLCKVFAGSALANLAPRRAPTDQKWLQRTGGRRSRSSARSGVKALEGSGLDADLLRESLAQTQARRLVDARDEVAVDHDLPTVVAPSRVLDFPRGGRRSGDLALAQDAGPCQG